MTNIDSELSYQTPTTHQPSLRTLPEMKYTPEYQPLQGGHYLQLEKSSTIESRSYYKCWDLGRILKRMIDFILFDCQEVQFRSTSNIQLTNVIREETDRSRVTQGVSQGDNAASASVSCISSTQRRKNISTKSFN